jgi:hypothetical protein
MAVGRREGQEDGREGSLTVEYLLGRVFKPNLAARAHNQYSETYGWSDEDDDFFLPPRAALSPAPRIPTSSTPEPSIETRTTTEVGSE